RKESSAIPGRGFHNPFQRVNHNLFSVWIARALKKLYAMPVRLQLFCAAISARDECACYGSDGAAAGKDLLEQKHPEIQSGSQYLSPSDMAKIVMRYFVSQYSSKMLVVCFLEKTRCHVKLANASVGSVDAGIVNDRDTDVL